MFFNVNFQDAWQCDICGSKSGKGFGKRFLSIDFILEYEFLQLVLEEIVKLISLNFMYSYSLNENEPKSKICVFK